MEIAGMDLQVLRDTPVWDWPEDAGARLLAVLKDASASQADRLVAAELAGDMTGVDEVLIAILLSILRRTDESEDLRAQAAISLGPCLEEADMCGFDDPDDTVIPERTFQTIQETFLSVFQDESVPQYVRRRVLEASVRAPQDWHAEAIRAAYASDDQTWRLTAVFCMAYVRGFNTQIVEALAGDDPEIRYEAVVAAGNWEVDAAWPYVAELVRADDTDKPLLLAAIESASSIRPAEAAELLGGLLESTDEDIVEAVHEAIAMADARLDFGEDDEDDEP
jgi:hypothetical protein